MASQTNVLPSDGSPSSGAFAGIIVAAIVVTALSLGQDVFIPVALAVLLSFMLTPLVIRLQRFRVPKGLAVVISVTIAFILITSFAYVVASQLTQLARSLPSYQSNVQIKIETLRASALTDGLFSRLGRFAEQINEELSSANPLNVGEGSGGAGAASEAPMRVQVEEPTLGPVGIIRTIIAPLIAPLATAGIVIVLVIFILLKRQDLRDRLIRLLGAGDLSKTTTALEDAGSRVARYLLMQLVVNATYGVPVALGLWWIGVPNALLWGMMAIVLRFVPYIGPIIAAVLPIGLAIAVDPGWTMVWWTVALFVLLELISNNIVEPWLYGSRTGLSTFAIIVAAIFWTWLWGPIGLLLSTPLTVCLVVLGRHVPSFAFLDVLLGSEPVLTPAERLTQRLLAGDADEATEVAETYLAEHSLLSFYEVVGLPALIAIERDRDSGKVDANRRQLVADTMAAVIENLSDHEDIDGTESEASSGSVDTASSISTQQQVLCLGGKGALDDAAAAMVAQLLLREGINAIATSLVDLSNNASSTSALVCISYLAERSEVRARYLTKRLLRRDANADIVVALWAVNGAAADRQRMEQRIRAPILGSSLPDALEAIKAKAIEPRNGIAFAAVAARSAVLASGQRSLSVAGSSP